MFTAETRRIEGAWLWRGKGGCLALLSTAGKARHPRQARMPAPPEITADGSHWFAGKAPTLPSAGVPGEGKKAKTVGKCVCPYRPKANALD
jgi:hypothetical protein